MSQGTGESTEEPRVRRVGPAQAIPVYNCHVYLTPADAEGKVRARAATLQDLSVEATSERDALHKMVLAIKQELTRYEKLGESLPWTDRPLDKRDDEVERWVAIHLF